MYIDGDEVMMEMKWWWRWSDDGDEVMMEWRWRWSDEMMLDEVSDKDSINDYEDNKMIMKIIRWWWR